MSLVRWPIRKKMAVTMAVAWFLSYADRVNMSVAVIPMQVEFGWTETVKGIVLASVFLGYISSQLFGGWATDRFGGQRVLAVAVIGFSLLTLLTPVAAETSFAVLIVARTLLGVAEGLAVPATYALIGRWSIVSDRARLLAIVVSGATLGAPGGLIISGWLVEHTGWQMAFYGFGTLGLAWAVFWLMRAHAEPDRDPRVSQQERDLLAASRVERDAKVEVPWRRIIAHPAIWAIVLAKFCALWTVYVFLAWLPSYFSAVQGISVAGSGLFAALPWIAMSAMLYVASWRADGMIRLGRDVTFVRKLMQSIGLLGSTVFLVLVPFAGSAIAAAALTCAAMGMLAFCYSGADPTVMEVAPRYAGSITGLVGTIGNLPGIIAIPLIGWIVDSTGSYSSGFVLAAVINVIGIIVWLAFGTARRVLD